MKIPTAMILAAGFGKRMLPLTKRMPKPLLDVNDKPLLDWALDRLINAECTNIVVNVHYLKDQIESHLKNRMDISGITGVTCIAEDPVLETGGGIQNALSHGLLGTEPFYVCNADNLWVDLGTPALARLAAAWDDQTMDGLLLLHDVEHAHGYAGTGDFSLGGKTSGVLSRFDIDTSDKKPYVFTGVQILHPRLFSSASGGAYSLNVLYDQALAQGRLHGLVHTGDWYHVGTPSALAATDRILRGDA